MQKNNITPDNFWCARAIKEYIKIKLANKTPKAIKEAQHLLLQYESLELSGTNEEIETLKKSLNEYYNFFKKWFLIYNNKLIGISKGEKDYLKLDTYLEE